jgi:hypothetical protein
MNEWMKQRDVLIQETLAFVQGITVNGATDPTQSVVPLVQRPVVGEVSSPKSRIGMERAMIQSRPIFAARRQRFQQEREEYFERTMKAARATQRDAEPNHLGTMTISRG